MSMWRSVYIICRFELLQRLRSPALIIMMLIAPLISVVGTFLPLSHSLDHEPVSQDRTILLGGCPHALLDQLNERFASLEHSDNRAYRVHVLPMNSDDLERGEYALAAMLGGDSLHYTLSIEGRQGDADLIISELVLALQSAKGNAALSPVSVHHEIIESASSKATHTITLISILSLQILSLSLVSGSAQILVRSLFEERASRLLDVVISSSSSAQVIIGKYLAVALFGLIHVALWTLVVSISSNSIFHLSFTKNALSIALHSYLCFTFYASLYSLMAASIQKESTAQALSAMTTFTLVIPMAIGIGTAQQAGSSGIALLEMFPFSVMFVQGLRSIESATVLSFDHWWNYVWILSCTGLCVYAAARNFRRQLQRGTHN